MSLDLRELAGTYDPGSRPVFLSLYADLSNPLHEAALRARARTIRAALGKAGEEVRFEEAWQRANDLLEELASRHPEAEGAAVFVSAVHGGGAGGGEGGSAGGFARAGPLPAPVPTRLVLDSSPYIRPLARFADEYASFLLVLLDGGAACVYLVDEAKAELEARRRSKLSGRHTKGGWSQMRYQRHRQGAQERFYGEVAERVAEMLRRGEADRIVVAGPGQAKRGFLDALPKQAAEAVIAVEDVDFDGVPDDALVRRFIQLARRLEAEASQEAVAALQAALLKGDLAVAGPFPVVRAARHGRTDLLVVAKDHRAGGRKCEAHQAFFEAEGACPHCGGAGIEVDLVNEAVEYAVLHGSRVEFVDAEREGFLQGIGGVGALLRW